MSDRVRVVLDPAEYDWEQTDELPELVEGLDIADPEFEDWVRDQRLAFADRAEEARDRAQSLRRRRLQSVPPPAAPGRQSCSRPARPTASRCACSARS